MESKHQISIVLCTVMLLCVISSTAYASNCWPRSPKSTPDKNYLSACVMFKNEAHYLKEWLTFHQVAGFDHMWMYNHNSTDNSLEVMKPFVDSGFVSVIDWNGPPGHVQTMQIQHCLSNYANKTYWLAIFDIDEFIMTFHDFGGPKPGFLARSMEFYEPYAALEIRRANFDSNGHADQVDGLVLKEYTSRWIDENYAAKLIIQPQLIATFAGHTAEPVEGKQIVDAYFRDVAKGRHFLDSPVRINHYITRSFNECLKKMKQDAYPGSWRAQSAWYCHNAQFGEKYYYLGHHFEDDLSLKFVPLVEKCMQTPQQ